MPRLFTKERIEVKRCILISIITILIFALIVPMGCKTAKFELSSLGITPSKVATGDTATISVDLANVGSAEGTYTVTFSLDAVVIDTKDVTIPAETTREVTCTVVKETDGEYTVEIGSLSGTLHVVKPAEWELASLVVTPQEVLPNEEVTVTVDVSNIGGLEGDYTCTLVVNTIQQESKEVTVDGGVTETVTFTFTPSYAGGRCDIEIGELTEEIRTLRPADIKVTSVSASPKEIEIGSSVTVTVDLRNHGDVEGSHIVTLEVDGATVGTRSITIGGKDTTHTATVDFTITEDTIGRHSASVDGQSDYFLVIPAAQEPPEGEPQIGSLAPDFQLQDLNGETVSLSDLRGSPVILNFWATWCGACRSEMPYLQQVYDEWQGQGLVILTISLREPSTTVADFMQTNNLSFPVLLDINDDVRQMYIVSGIPTTFFIDEDGIIQAIEVYSFSSVQQIEDYLSEIMP